MSKHNADGTTDDYYDAIPSDGPTCTTAEFAQYANKTYANRLILTPEQEELVRYMKRNPHHSW